MKAFPRLLLGAAILLGTALPILLGIPRFTPGARVPPAVPAEAALDDTGREDVLRVSGNLRVLLLEGAPYERGLTHGRTLDQMRNACPRFNFLKRTLADNTAPLGLEDLKTIYRDRASGINNGGTYACTIMLLGDAPELHIAPGRPDTEPFQVLTFSGRQGVRSPRAAPRRARLT